MSVGVVVPVYGRGRYLPEALDGVLRQEPAPDEVIVVDDCSPAPVRLAAAHASRCRLVRRDVRGGPGAARDTAIALLDTELVALADGDDVWLPGKLQAQLHALTADPELELCFGMAAIIGADGRPTGERWEQLPAGALESGDLIRTLYERNPIPTSSVVVRRRALIAAGGFAGPWLCEDWSLWLRLAAAGVRFAFEPRAKIAYRRHGDGATADIAALAECALAVHETHRELVDEPVWRRARAADLTALARGRIRERRYADARGALRDAAALATPRRRDSVLRAVLAVPGLRAVVGRRPPY